MKNNPARFSTVYMLASAILFSLGGLFVKVCSWSPLAMNSLRNVFAAFVIFGYFHAHGHKFRCTKTVLLGGAAYAVTNIFFVAATKLTTAANAIVLQFTVPIFIILFSWLFFRQKPKKIDSITCAIVFFGIILFFLDGLSAGNNFGNALALISGVSYAIVFMLKTLPGADTYSPILAGQIMCIVAGLPAIFQETDFSPFTLSVIAVQGLLQVGLAFIFFIKGLDLTPPVTAALISTIEPILNPIWVAIFYGEKVSPLSLCGAAVVVVAIGVYNILKAKQPPASSGQVT